MRALLQSWRYADAHVRSVVRSYVAWLACAVTAIVFLGVLQFCSGESGNQAWRLAWVWTACVALLLALVSATFFYIQLRRCEKRDLRAR